MKKKKKKDHLTPKKKRKPSPAEIHSKKIGNLVRLARKGDVRAINALAEMSKDVNNKKAIQTHMDFYEKKSLKGYAKTSFSKSYPNLWPVKK